MGTFYKELGGKKDPWELWPRLGPIMEALNQSSHPLRISEFSSEFWVFLDLVSEKLRISEYLLIFTYSCWQ